MLRRALLLLLLTTGALLALVRPSSASIYVVSHTGTQIDKAPSTGGTGTFARIVDNLTGVTALATNGTYLFWTDGTSISRAGIDGSDPHVIVSGLTSVSAVAANPTRVYWTSNESNIGHVSRAALDGTGVESSIVTAGASNPFYYLTLNSTSLFWFGVQSGSVRQLWQLKLDGSPADVKVSPNSQTTYGALAASDSILYGARAGTTSPIDGIAFDRATANQYVASNGKAKPGVATDGCNIYYTATGVGDVFRARADGQAANEFANGTPISPTAVAADATGPQVANLECTTYSPGGDAPTNPPPPVATASPTPSPGPTQTPSPAPTIPPSLSGLTPEQIKALLPLAVSVLNSEIPVGLNTVVTGDGKGGTKAYDGPRCCSPQYVVALEIIRLYGDGILDPCAKELCGYGGGVFVRSAPRSLIGRISQSPSALSFAHGQFGGKAGPTTTYAQMQAGVAKLNAAIKGLRKAQSKKLALVRKHASKKKRKQADAAIKKAVKKIKALHPVTVKFPATARGKALQKQLKKRKGKKRVGQFTLRLTLTDPITGATGTASVQTKLAP